MSAVVLHCHGVRGSLPTPEREFSGFGGNTASFFIATREGTQIYLDAGTGIVGACEEHLGDGAARTVLLISHTHADHVYGLGLCGLRWKCTAPGRPGTGVEILGPPKLRQGLDSFYDGRHTWPILIGRNAPSVQMPCFDPAGIRSLGDGDDLRIDRSATVRAVLGSHPVEGGVMLFRLELQTDSGTKSLVYATDTEFHFLPGPAPNPDGPAAERKYRDLVSGADLLLADGMYSRPEYYGGDPRDHRGFGHLCIDDLVDLASDSGVRSLLVTHHGRHPDPELARREALARERAAGHGGGMKVSFARERDKVTLG